MPTNKIECSPETPWGIHLPVRNDEDCARCGWTAPGRFVRAPAQPQVEAWTVIEGGAERHAEPALPSRIAA